MFHYARRAPVAFLLSFVSFAQTQPPQDAESAITPVGSGYRLEGPSIPAAPGQVLLVSVFGVKTRISAPEVAVPTATGLPKSLAGISVDFVQGSTIIPLDLRGIQQGTCALGEACSTMTSITLQIPFSLEANPFPVPHLRIKENGTAVGSVMVRPVTDRIHVMNTCDATLISVGAASSVPRDVCAPAVMVNGRLNSLYNLIRGGDTVSLWAFGLGAPRGASAGTDPLEASRVAAPILLSFDFRPNAVASPGVVGYGITAEPQYAGHIGVGTYQVNYLIPPIPAGLPACDGIKIASNLTVTMSGPNSYDAAQLCVEP